MFESPKRHHFHSLLTDSDFETSRLAPCIRIDPVGITLGSQRPGVPRYISPSGFALMRTYLRTARSQMVFVTLLAGIAD